MSKMYHSNGMLDGTGNSLYGAKADHNHDDSYTVKNIAAIVATKKSVKVADWHNKTATLEYEGEFFDIAVSEASKEAATAANISMTSAEDGVITLTCETTPSVEIKLYVFSRM